MPGGAKRDFTLRQLSTFVCAARTASFARAADELGISQPAVSDHIAMLEKRLGYPLFLRRRGTTPLLTREGLDLLQKAEVLLDASHTMRDGDRAGAGRKVRVRLCIGPRLRDVYLKPILPTLYRDHPQIELEFVPAIAVNEVQDALEAGRVDLLVYTIGQPVETWPNAHFVGDVPIVMVGPRGIRARLAAGATTIDDLQFILPATRHLSEHWLERQLRRLGFRLRNAILYVDFADVIQQMVEDGAGVSILMQEQVASSIAAGRLEVFGPAFPPMRRVIARSQTAPVEARIVQDALVDAFAAAAPSAAAS